ncbi:hypothetical protein MKP15_04255 [Stenotrophomonas sp. Y6]|uniref:hypothetical protein n=1 Tax=Stenotrophomonas sp. Y6 TaxID=2920383 RepID=UPI001F05680E|nr:hypothetical protein [Stenotrophomonas sp. Y6]MCH1907985.1 hypothetical protein [Stenotrophomonas sp. Y6]
MSENETKPVVVDHTVAAQVACESHGEGYGIDWIWHHDGIGLLHPQSAIDRLTAERDATLADARRLRSVIDYALAQHNYGAHPRQNHWAAKAMSELAAMDAARLERGA